MSTFFVVLSLLGGGSALTNAKVDTCHVTSLWGSCELGYLNARARKILKAGQQFRHARNTYTITSAASDSSPETLGIRDEDIRLRAIRSSLVAVRSTTCHPSFLSAVGLDASFGSVAVGQSSIAGAGLGLFATAALDAGTAITFYPVHGCGIDFADGNSMCVTLESCDQLHFEKDELGSYRQALLGSRPLLFADVKTDFSGSTLFVDANPNDRSVNQGWEGHIINDGAVVRENSERGILSYYEASRSTKNCVVVPFGPSPLMVAVTTKSVDKGAELFHSYGCSYWLDSLLWGSDEEITDITEAIQAEVYASAIDLMNGMQGAQKAYAREIDSLDSVFGGVGIECSEGSWTATNAGLVEASVAASIEQLEARKRRQTPSEPWTLKSSKPKRERNKKKKQRK